MIYCYTEQTGWAAGSGVELSTLAVEETCERQPSLLAAIAHELSKIDGGTTAEHLLGAKRVLEEAFCTVERTDRMTSSISVQISSNEPSRRDDSVGETATPGRITVRPGDRPGETFVVHSRTKTLNPGGNRCLFGAAVA